MHQPKFWNMRSATSTSKYAEWAHDEMDLETVICPTNEGHQGPGKRLTDLSVTLPGSTVEDIVWTWYSECLLTDRVLELFKGGGFTGFEVKPVKARYKRTDAEPPRLWELIVTGWAGTAPPESGIRLIKRCDTCGLTQYSGGDRPDKLIVPSKWDGSDFFMVWPLPKYVFVTDRVAQIVRSNHLSGAALKPPSELDLSGGFGPGRLSYHMPEVRARELGEPLGIY